MGNNIKTKNKVLATLISTIIIFALIPAITTPAAASAEDKQPNQLISEVSAAFNKPSNGAAFPLPEQNEDGRLYLSTESTGYKAFISELAWYYSTTGEEQDYTTDMIGYQCGDGKDTFEEELYYRVYISFQCDDGYAFPDDPEYITIKINNIEIPVADVQPHEVFCIYDFTVGEPDDDPHVTEVIPSASVEQLKGNQNALTITVTELLSDGSTKIFTERFMINNNAAGTYTVGDYRVFVETKGNTQIRSIYIVE